MHNVQLPPDQRPECAKYPFSIRDDGCHKCYGMHVSHECSVFQICICKKRSVVIPVVDHLFVALVKGLALRHIHLA